MDNDFGFLDKSDSDVLREILERRNPMLMARIGQTPAVSAEDACEVVSAVLDEFINNLGADWEPTEYGKRVSRILTSVNDRRISELPE
jgi:hypothetical protein